MIAKLTGVIDSVGSNYVIIDVNGVGYLVYASGRTLARIGSQAGTAVSLLIDTHVREDHITLYGFCDVEEKDWFQVLCTVQGVGAKAGLSILSCVTPEQLPMVIASQDKAAIQRAEGVGPKLATRIVTELKEKAGKMALGSAAQQQAASAQGKKKTGAETNVALPQNASNDAVSALINLGYARAEAFGAVSTAARKLGEEADVQSLIRESLKELSA